MAALTKTYFKFSYLTFWMVGLLTVPLFSQPSLGTSQGPQKQKEQALGQTQKQVRCAIDIGSSGMRLQIAQILLKDKNETILDQTLFPMTKEETTQANRKISFKDEMEKNKTLHGKNEIPMELIEQAVRTLEEFKTVADRFHAVGCQAVATQAFRETDNHALITQKMGSVPGVLFQIVSQEEETRLGRLGVIGKLKLNQEDAKKAIVWDIGSGSIQISDHEGHLYLGTVAASDFKKMVLDIQGRPHNESPNPISQETYQQSKDKAGDISKQVPQVLQEKLKSPQFKVYGIGGVHNGAVKQQLKLASASYTSELLNQAILERLNLGDDAPLIQGKYASTQVSNLILVKGFMDKLGVKEVYPVDINLTEGVMLHALYWPDQKKEAESTKR